MKWKPYFPLKRMAYPRQWSENHLQSFFFGVVLMIEMM